MGRRVGVRRPMRPVVRQVREMARTQLRAREGRSALVWEEL
jgi:hypothetical protein